MKPNEKFQMKTRLNAGIENALETNNRRCNVHFNAHHLMNNKLMMTYGHYMHSYTQISLLDYCPLRLEISMVYVEHDLVQTGRKENCMK